MKIPYIACALVSLLLLGGCSTPEAPQSGTYTITEIDGAAVTAEPPIRVVYKDNTLSGKGPVNNWVIPVQEDGRLGLGISTRMAGPPELMELENKLLQALDGGTLQTAPAQGLVIFKDGHNVIRMQPAPDEAAQTTD